MSSTTRVRTSGSVSGGTPWPRLRTWPGAAGSCGNDFADVCFEDVPRSGQEGGVNVPLQRYGAAQPAVGFVERQPVVHAHDVHPDVAHGNEEF